MLTETSPEQGNGGLKGPGLTLPGYSPGGTKKVGLFPVIRRRSRIAVPVSKGTGQVGGLHGQGFMRNIHSIISDLQNGIMPDQEELPGPAGRPDLKFPGSYRCQENAMKAGNLSLVLVQDLQRVCERCLRSFYFHKHDPVRFDDDEIECTASRHRPM
jgi:hypothetical protein